MLKIAICDDEKIIRDKINKLLKTIDAEYEIRQFQSGNEIVETTCKFDLYILDIEMPELNGVEVAKRLIKLYEKPNIIFLTSHTEFMQFGYKVRAFRFLIKPINDDEFIEAILEVEKEIDSAKILILEENGEKTFVRYADIIYIESLGDETAIHTTRNLFKSNNTLRYFLEELGTICFFQVHKQYIVALGRVLGIGTHFVKLHNIKIEIPISRRKKKLLDEAVLRYINENERML